MYYKFRVCNICQDTEISEDNEWGVCTTCVDSRIADGLWILDGHYICGFITPQSNDPDLPYIRTNEYGERIDEQDFTINGETHTYEI
tara:strand:+ start:4317 stop:4577 length:261 start_codon:yes stop_codon:yes gene_type:complete